MKALTVKQPWANAIVFDGKNVENRSRPTKHRGRLYIHAGASWESSAVGFHCQAHRKGVLGGKPGHCARDTGSVRCSEWAMPDHYHWVLANPMPIEVPFPAKGKLGLWNFEGQP